MTSNKDNWLFGRKAAKYYNIQYSTLKRWRDNGTIEYRLLSNKCYQYNCNVDISNSNLMNKKTIIYRKCQTKEESNTFKSFVLELYDEFNSENTEDAKNPPIVITDYQKYSFKNKGCEKIVTMMIKSTIDNLIIVDPKLIGDKSIYDFMKRVAFTNGVTLKYNLKQDESPEERVKTFKEMLFH